MGISAEQYWKQSQNGKAMVLMIARRGDVELVRDCLEWLIGKQKKDLEVQARQKGATENQAKIIAENGVAGLYAQAEAISDRDVYPSAEHIIDTIFKRFFTAGPVHYQKALAWFAGELRAHVKEDKRLK